MSRIAFLNFFADFKSLITSILRLAATGSTDELEVLLPLVVVVVVVVAATSGAFVFVCLFLLQLF